MYVVWSPQLGAQERHVPGATALVSDGRARHYWDGGMLIGRLYQQRLGLGAPAWDVWMLFDQHAVWRSDSAPPPAWWEHQLGNGPQELRLDPERFAARAEALHEASAGSR